MDHPDEWSCLNDLAARFLIIKVVFVRGLLFNVLLDDKFEEANRQRGSQRDRATKNVTIFGEA